jgi:hypothetical protein
VPREGERLTVTRGLLAVTAKSVGGELGARWLVDADWVQIGPCHTASGSGVGVEV